MSKLRELWLRAQTCLVPPRRKSDQGASIIEYAAVIILVAAVAAAVFAIGIPDRVSQGVQTSITEILSGGGSEEGEGSG